MNRTLAVAVVFLVVAVNAQQISITGGNQSRRVVEPNQKRNTNSTLTNNDVIDLKSLGVSDELVIEKIRSAETVSFDTSVAGIKRLKESQISDSIIREMIRPATTKSATKKEADDTLEVGVYTVISGQRKEMEPEIVGWQSGGVVKSLATLGITKGHVNGKVMGENSQLRLAAPVEFIIKTVEGTSVTEYQLLKLYKKSNRREFRALTGGVFHASGGAERTALQFNSEKIGNRTWRIRLDRLGTGEYGFLPPGVSSASLSASGKIYTFTILE